MTAREFYQIALQELPYISFEFEVVEQFLKEGYEPNTDLLQDYILSNDLADEVKYMSSKRIYNMVLQATDVCPEGELLTDKELERMKLNNVKRDWPKTSKVKVYGEDVYFNFGVRFATVIQEVIQENNGNKQNNI